MVLKLHGVPLSQPFRSVAWACLQKRLPFEVALVVPGMTSKMGSKGPASMWETRPVWPASAARPRRRTGRGWPKLAAAWSTIWRGEGPPESQLAEV